jgi:hypothetical protein
VAISNVEQLVADRILVPLSDGRWLSLDREVFNVALAAGAECMGAPLKLSEAEAPATKLLTAEQLETRTGVSANWFESRARERRIPFRKIGRYVRFDYEELMASEAFQRRAIPPSR